MRFIISLSVICFSLTAAHYAISKPSSFVRRFGDLGLETRDLDAQNLDLTYSSLLHKRKNTSPPRPARQPSGTPLSQSSLPQETGASSAGTPLTRDRQRNLENAQIEINRLTAESARLRDHYLRIQMLARMSPTRSPSRSPPRPPQQEQPSGDYHQRRSFEDSENVISDLHIRKSTDSPPTSDSNSQTNRIAPGTDAMIRASLIRPAFSLGVPSLSATLD